MSSNPSPQADEHAPLLEDCTHDTTTPSLTAAKQSIQSKTKLATLLLVGVLYFNVYVCLAPESRIREDIVCRAYFKRLDGGVSAVDPLEHDCTIDPVQKELNLVTQIYMTLAQLPGRCDEVVFRSATVAPISDPFLAQKTPQKTLANLDIRFRARTSLRHHGYVHTRWFTSVMLTQRCKADRVGRKTVLRLSIIGIVLCDTFKLFVRKYQIS
jgi:hypothetical protein